MKKKDFHLLFGRLSNGLVMGKRLNISHLDIKVVHESRYEHVLLLSAATAYFVIDLSKSPAFHALTFSNAVDIVPIDALQLSAN